MMQYATCKDLWKMTNLKHLKITLIAKRKNLCFPTEMFDLHAQMINVYCLLTWSPMFALKTFILIIEIPHLSKK